MPNTRLTKKVFNWDYRRALMGRKGWNHDLKKLLQSTEQSDVFYGLGVEQPRQVLTLFGKCKERKEEKSLIEDINTMQKLRTYKDLKLTIGTEDYITTNMERHSRSLISKIRIGTLPINIETGRYKQQAVQDRKCPNCTDLVEDEKHFLMDCPMYEDARDIMYRKVQERTGIDTTELGKDDLFYLLLNVTKAIRPAASFIKESMTIRSKPKPKK